MSEFNIELAQKLANSQEDFPVDLDDAWGWLGYKAKRDCKDLLINNFEEGVDFLRKGTKSAEGGRPSQWVVLTVDCFKSLGMMAGTNKGKEVRKYFLQCEKIAKQKTPSELSRKDILMMALQAEEEKLALEAEVEKQKTLIAQKDKAIQCQQDIIVEWHPLVKNYRQFMDTEGLLSMSEAAKMLPNTGRNRLIRVLRMLGILMPNKCEPYQKYMKHFEVKVKVREHVSRDGTYKSDTVTLFTPKGFNSILKTLIRKVGDESLLMEYLQNPLLLEAKLIDEENAKTLAKSEAMYSMYDALEESGLF